jgi:hypothetical protein
MGLEFPRAGLESPDLESVTQHCSSSKFADVCEARRQPTVVQTQYGSLEDFFPFYFIRIYSLYRGIHSDNSN